MAGSWAFLVVLWLVTVGVIVISSRPTSDQQLLRWSQRFNVLVDDTTRGWVARQLRRSRTIRWSSFAVGVNVSMLPMYMNVIDVERASSFNNELTNQSSFLIAASGAVLAEVLMVSRPSGKRSAGLVTRHWSDYVQRLWLLVIAATLPISLIATWIGPASGERVRFWWAAPVVTVFAILAATIGVRIVVNRPAHGAAGQLGRLDDALRADGAHHIVGAAVAVAGSAACSTVSRAMGTSWWQIIPGIASIALIGIWWGLARDTKWNVDQVRMQHA